MRPLPRPVAFLLRVLEPFAVLFLAGLLFYLGIQSERTGFVREVLDPGLKRIALPVLNALRGSPPDSHGLQLLIEPEAMDSLGAMRERALKAGVLNEGKDTWFPARIVWQGDTLGARLRLKGGLTDHLRTRKWSMRVQLLEGDTVLGMTTFSLQHPNTRNFTNEWIFHEALRDQDLPHLLYEFTEVRLNERDLGLFAVEQHFDTTLTTRLGLGHAPILKFDDEARIGSLEQMNERIFPSTAPYEGEWLAAPVEAFHMKEVMEAPLRKAAFSKAALALEAFRQRKRSTHEVFDVQALARLFALADLLGAQHCTDWRNLRFVPDPATGLLLPIGFDANAGEPIPAIRAFREQGPIHFDTQATGFYDRLFSDPLFLRAYVAHVDTLSQEGWLEDLLERLNDRLQERVRLVQREFPNFRHDVAVFQHDRVVMRQALRPMNIALAYLQERKGATALVSGTVPHGLPVEVGAITAGPDTVVFHTPFMLLPRASGEPMAFQPFEVPWPKGPGKVRLLVRIPGLKEWTTIPVRDWAVVPSEEARMP
ncbi:MAG: hypothetical protein JNM31_12945 [Flavobacteriales bacterium]|nr:hypothetical protein [Flavobacteriales bacterium]